MEERLNAIGDTTIHVEKTIRNIKGDSALLLNDDPIPEDYNNCVKTLFGHGDTIECLDFEHSHSLLVSGSADKTIRVWDLSNNESVGVLEGHSGWVRCIQLSGYKAMSGSGDHTLKLWDLSQLEPVDTVGSLEPINPLVKNYQGHTGGVTCLQFDQATLMSGSADKTLKQWDMETGQVLATLRTEQKSSDSFVDQLVFGQKPLATDSPYAHLLGNQDFEGWRDTPTNEAPVVKNSGGHVASLYFWQYAMAAGYGDGVIRLWDLRSGTYHRELGSHVGAVSAVQFDDTCIYSGSVDRTFKVFTLM